MLDPSLAEQVAAALGTEPALVEKEWHIVRAIGVIAALDHGAARPVFSGGKSLSVALGLIKRFSEDIDFKVVMPESANPSQGRARRRAFRERVLAALVAADFQLVGEARKASRFFSADFVYPNRFDPVASLRPYLQIEMTFDPPALPPLARPIRSLVALAQKREPEVAAFPCVDPIETAADKLSALAWRVCARDRTAPQDDPTVVRHLYDLAALESHIARSSAFPSLVATAAAADTGRGGGRSPPEPAARLALMIERLAGDPMWAGEYARFVTDKSFATVEERISFAAALDALKRLVRIYQTHNQTDQRPAQSSFQTP